MLEAGTYQTRNMRVVKLAEPFAREKRVDGGAVKTVTGFTGTMMKADGKTPDSAHDWEDTTLPNTLGVFVRAGATEGVANEFDLIRRIE